MNKDLCPEICHLRVLLYRLRAPQDGRLVPLRKASACPRGWVKFYLIYSAQVHQKK